MIEDPCMVCGAESEFGCHGIKDSEVYSEFFCETHYNERKRGHYETEAVKPAEAIQRDMSEEHLRDLGSRRPVSSEVSVVQYEADALHL